MRLRLSAWIALSTCLVSACAVFATGRGDDVRLGDDLEVTRLTDTAWRVVSRRDMGGDWGTIPANGLLVLSGDVAALIDTPWTDEQTRRLFDWVEREHGARIEVIVPTHSHGDCLGGLAAAHELGARSYGHERTAEFARRSGDAAPEATFRESYDLQLGNRRLELRHLGAGHTEDNIVAWLPDEKILFGGCLIKSAHSQTMGYVDEADLDAWPETLERVRRRYGEEALIVPGHGRPGGLETIERTLRLIEEYRSSN